MATGVPGLRVSEQKFNAVAPQQQLELSLEKLREQHLGKELDREKKT